MLKRLLLAAALAAGFASPVLAQNARVISGGCGTVPGTLALNDASGLFIDTVGRLCVSGGPVTPSAAANHGITPTNGGTQTAYVAKSSGGNLYGFSVTMSTTAGFLALLNTATAPAAGAAITPLECVAVPASGWVARRQDIADRYGAGITVLLTSSCTTYTAVAPLVSTVLVQ